MKTMDNCKLKPAVLINLDKTGNVPIDRELSIIDLGRVLSTHLFLFH